MIVIYNDDNDENDDDSLLHGGGRGGGYAVSLALAHVHIILAGPDQLLPLGVFLLGSKMMLQFLTNFVKPSQDESQRRESHTNFHIQLWQILSS